jgi:hypothetical protein
MELILQRRGGPSKVTLILTRLFLHRMQSSENGINTLWLQDHLCPVASRFVSELGTELVNINILQQK